MHFSICFDTIYLDWFIVPTEKFQIKMHYSQEHSQRLYHVEAHQKYLEN